MMDDRSSVDSDNTLTTYHRQRAWADLSHVITAHLIMLRDEAVFDDDVLAALLSALDGVSRADPPEVGTLDELVAAFDQRLDALTPRAAAGAASVGRARAEVVATVLHLTIRDSLAAFAAALLDTRRALIDLAGHHLITLMPTYVDGVPTQPTTFAHFLGGVVSPLGRHQERLRTAYTDANRSPMGAFALGGSALPVSRERVAELLGCQGPILNTFDALGATDTIATTASVIGEVGVSLRRLMTELITWVRTDPMSIRFTNAESIHDTAVPQHEPPTRVIRLEAAARGVEREADQVVSLARSFSYGPVGVAATNLSSDLSALGANATAQLRATRELLTNHIEINQAYLANRVGKALTTSSELAPYFLLEEGLGPAEARDLAALITRRAKEENLEASHITSQMVDGAALLALGRELGIEIESLSRYLGPRRSLERRTATGTPAREPTRAWLDQERIRLGADERWWRDAAERVQSAAAQLEWLTEEALNE